MNATTSPDLQQRTADAVQYELKLAQELHELLDREKTVLSERDFPTLSQVTETKLALVNRLESQVQQRARLMPGASPADWEALIELSPPELRDSWTQLKHELTLCQEINRINELVVARSKRATQHVLNLLKGNTEPQDLYTKAGNKVSSRSLGAYLSV